MSEATLLVEQGVHTVEWGTPEHVRVEFDLFHNDARHGELSAECATYLTDPAIMQRLHRARITLTSTQSRATYAKHCDGLTNSSYQVDWRSLINTAADIVVDAYRTGQPAVSLRDVEEPPGADWLIRPLVLARHPTIWFGDGSTGKSYLALAAAASIHTGRNYLGGEAPTATARVAYLDWEFDAWEHRKRLRHIVDEDSIVPDLVYVPCSGPIRDQVDRLRRIFKDQSVGFAVIDSVGPACGGEPESAEIALQFFEAVRRLGVGTLCIAHVTKVGAKNQTDRPFGSAYWHNLARSTWLVRKVQEINATTFRIGMFNKKSNSGPLAGAVSYELSFNGTHTGIKPTSVFATPEFQSGLSISQRIRHAIQGGPKTYKQLEEELGVDYATIKSKVHNGAGTIFVRLEGEGGVTRVGLMAHDPSPSEAPH